MGRLTRLTRSLARLVIYCECRDALCVRDVTAHDVTARHHCRRRFNVDRANRVLRLFSVTDQNWPRLTYEM